MYTFIYFFKQNEFIIFLQFRINQYFHLNSAVINHNKLKYVTPLAARCYATRSDAMLLKQTLLIARSAIAQMSSITSYRYA